MQKIVIIDDDQHFLEFFTGYIKEKFPRLEIVTFSDPVRSLPVINSQVDLLLIDLEMPTLDGTKLLSFACDQGVSKAKIIILSGREADYLHKKIPMGTCLAVLNKHEARQKEVLDMVFAALQNKDIVTEKRQKKTG